MLREEYDLVVIGGGPTGLTAALAAASAGRTCVIVDATKKNQVQFSGPTGLFSKALRDASKKIDVGTLRKMGLKDVTVWKQVQELTSDIVKASGQSNLAAVQACRIPHLRGSARLMSSSEVEVTFTESNRSIPVRGKRILVATGSTPYRMPGIPYDQMRIFDSDTIRMLTFLPKTVTIVGAGIIAIEFAKIFSRLDCKVTMLVRAKSLDVALLRIGVDRDAALQLQKDLCMNKVRIIFDTEVEEVIKEESPRNANTVRPMRIKLRKASTKESQPHAEIRTEVLMTATGRSANTRGMGLEGLGVNMDKDGAILVNGNMETSVKGVYAAGDVLGAPSLASTGIEQGNAAVTHMFGFDSSSKSAWMLRTGGRDPKSLTANPLLYPVGIWTIPEMAFIGRTKEKAIDDGWEPEELGEGLAQYSQTIRGRVQGINLGFLKLLFSKPDGVILGVHILGEDACELIHYGTALAQSGKTVYEALGTVYTAVTFHELFRIAAMDAVRQLEVDAWSPFLTRLGLGEEETHNVQDVRKRLGEGGMSEDDCEEICRALDQRADQDEEREGTQVSFQQIMQVVQKYRIPKPWYAP
ncbi:hypothetical protein GUITHDRAFT_101831 [Guillardia theta CCMP2712]|uniref:NAD(P)(+) transhydrogenase (Si-specific) n=1 Tax=Guillardia theta (strain CCMP2712) TaxID=905079 RepID=L1JWS8_GUITC|nr:hypothetical protein GUITHDRAFT_101831 [Guillardia theta CCMP2712]EKX52670.1 hypothetical protein GUITHDRAFT_101831 [Guillardia theta CCMP2712]|eukprot:XP_005839650.1 hypothetical protein GUITHDRAFT_101831 [Guillardia theta CCMP2712]